jgi:hypothetical protein
MKTTIRKTIGFMAGELVVPQDFDSMGRSRVEADFEARPQYQLKDLLDQCDFTQTASKVDDAWHGGFPVDQEEI